MVISAEKKLGHNTTWSIGGTSVAQVQTIRIPGEKRDDIDVTTLDSTIMDFVPSDPPEITDIELSIIWVSGLTSHEAIQTAVHSKTNSTHVIVLNSLTTVRTATFSGYTLEMIPEEIASKNPLMSRIRIRPTTVITWT